MRDVTFLMWAKVPQDQLAAFTQHIRNFDYTHPGCEFRIAADIPDMPLSRLVDIVRGVAPAFHHLKVFEP